MLNYWKADAFRVVRSFSFWIMTLISPVIYIAGVFMVSGPGYSADTHMSVAMMVGVFAAIFGGIGIYNTVYSQDIKAGALRVAIGRGIGRGRIVVAKLVETVVVAAVVALVFYAILRFSPLAFGIADDATLDKAIAVVALQFLLQTIIFSSLASIVSMARQESVTATVFYVLLAAGIVDQIIGLILQVDAVKSVVGNISGYLPQTLANELSAHIMGVGGSVALSSVVVYVCYILLSLLLSGWILSRKELEF